jgi:ElaA protein
MATMDLTWRDLAGESLTAQELHDVLALRCQVFVVEQESVYLDVDGLDLLPGTRHLLGTADGRLVCYARVLGPHGEAPAHVGRVIVAGAARGRSLGGTLMRRALDVVDAHWPGRVVEISAQAHLQEFYGRLGFTTTGGEYDDGGVPHVDMRRPPA